MDRANFEAATVGSTIFCGVDLSSRAGVRQRRFPGLRLRQALSQGSSQVDNIAAGRLARRRLSFLSLRLVFDQLFPVLGVGVVIVGRIEFVVMSSISFMARLTSLTVGTSFLLTGRRSSSAERISEAKRSVLRIRALPWALSTQRFSRLRNTNCATPTFLDWRALRAAGRRLSRRPCPAPDNTAFQNKGSGSGIHTRTPGSRWRQISQVPLPLFSASSEMTAKLSRSTSRPRTTSVAGYRLTGN